MAYCGCGGCTGGAVQIMRDSDGGLTAYLVTARVEDIHKAPAHFALADRITDWPGPSLNNYDCMTKAVTFYKQVTGRF